MDFFIEKTRQQEYENTMLVASSNALVEKLRMQSVNAANFDYLANAVLEQCDPMYRGGHIVRKISRKAQELIISDALDRLLEEGRLSYFGRLIHKKGLIRSVASLMDQLGSCGVTPEEIATAFSHWDGRTAAYRQKDREVAEIYGIYIRYLASHDVYDVAGLYRLAADKLNTMLHSGGGLKWGALYFIGFYRFNALQLSMIRSLSRCCDIWVALPYEGNRPGLYGVTEFTYGELMGMAMPADMPPVNIRKKAALRHIVKSLRNPEARPVPADDSIEIWQADDRQGEIRAVLRDIKKLLRDRVARPEEVAVVVRRLEDYSGIRSLCDEYGIPVQMPGSASLTANQVFHFILSILSSVPLHGREKAESWIAFLTQPLQRIALGLPAEVVGKLARAYYYTDHEKFLEDVLAETRCQSLRVLWDACEKIRTEASVQEYCGQVLDLLSALGFREKAGQLYKEGQLTLTEFKNIACAGEALIRLLQNLHQDYFLSGYENRIIPSAQFAEALTEAAETVPLILQPENSEGIAVISAANMEEASFRQVFAVGLRENAFPYYKNENWIYNDRERADLAALGVALPSSADSCLEDIRFFANVCAAATERLVLTFFTDEEQNVSPYIAELQSMFTNLPVQVKKAPVKAEDSLSREELELALAREGQTSFLQQLAPGIPEAACSDRKRLGNETNWNGNLADPVLLEQVGQRIGLNFSASKLETYRGCPFKFLVSYVWEQESPSEAEEVMNPMQRGNLLHEVLEKFIHNHLGEQLVSARRQELQAELGRIFTGTWQEFAERGRLYAGDFWRHDKELQQILLQGWLDKEILYSEAGGLRPVAVEKTFGRKDTGLMTMDINGRRILLNGKIDRIDKAGNKYFITDYKSGKVPKKTAFLDTDLQLPLYILAAERFLAGSKRNDDSAQEGGAIVLQKSGIVAAQEDDTVTALGRGFVAGGGYCLLKDGERKESFLFADASDAAPPWRVYSEITDKQGNKTVINDIQALKEKTEQVLAEILQGMRQGSFKPTPSRDCDFCLAAKICRWRIMPQDPEEEESHA